LSKVYSPGYFTLADSHIQVLDYWIGLVGEDPVPAPRQLVWTYFRDIFGHFRVAQNPEDVAARLNIESCDGLSYVVKWSSSQTGLFGYSDPVAIQADSLQEIPFTIRGSFLRRSLKIELFLVATSSLVVANSKLRQLVPSSSGSIVWRQSFPDVEIEGNVEQMTMRVRPFGNDWVFWTFEIDASDLFATSASCIEVVLNSDNPVALEIRSASGATNEHLQAFLKRDFYRQIVYEATLSPLFEMTEDYPAESLGGLFRRTLQVMGGDNQRMRRELADSPSRFEAQVQNFQWG
jgi:hypothetical protein